MAKSWNKLGLRTNVHFTGIKHPRWCVESFEELSDENKELLISSVWNLVNTLPFKAEVQDIELCGSYAYGCAQLHSDFDFNIVLSSDDLQNKVNQEAYSKIKPDWFLPFYTKVFELHNKLQVKLDVGFTNRDSRTYTVVYSTLEKKFFGKLYGEKIKMKLRWDRELHKFVVIPFRKKTVSFDPSSHA